MQPYHIANRQTTGSDVQESNEAFENSPIVLQVEQLQLQQSIQIVQPYIPSCLSLNDISDIVEEQTRGNNSETRNETLDKHFRCHISKATTLYRFLHDCLYFVFCPFEAPIIAFCPLEPQ